MMLKEIAYNRAEAVRYAETWAMRRNPKFPNFDQMGGDCTNFASQCIYAGCGVMNPTPVTGWYCNSLEDRSPAWSGVEFLYKFLITNKSVGPYAAETGTDMLEPGDVIQLGDADGHFYHTPVVLSVENGNILVAAHSFDACFRPLYTYSFSALRCLHILGARIWA
ncbi:MAG: Amidase-6 domain-containing protein [Thermocaproicibacter melissae]|jgi:hypothetical protein|uniref:amidase domain-containing protein n=1 Tax=Thermocaproicibacter melissae TaxID=2966552 RepID=UPI003A101766